MNAARKQSVLEEFSLYLEQLDEGMPETDAIPDLNTLLTEMEALKSSVKVESRHLKSTLDQFSASLEGLQKANAILSDELDQYRQRLLEQKRDIQRKMALELLGVYDRLAAGLAMLINYKPVDALFSHSKKQDRRFIASLREGQAMSIQRLEQLLFAYQVRPIDTQDKKFDPQTMIAVATAHKKKLPHGQVVEELRKGFYFEDTVLRLAEVKVNKHPG